MRCDQFMGLSKDARVFLSTQRKRCEHCKQCLPSPAVVGHYVGMFKDKYSLTRYVLRDGRAADEFLQVERWFGGPIFFIGLLVSDGKEFHWTREEIESAVE